MLPPFNDEGDLPPGLYQISLADAVARFGQGTVARRGVAARLERIYQLAVSTDEVRRFVVFGSFVTAKPEPGDVDVFLVMEDTFDVGTQFGEVGLLFDHLSAEAHFGATVFWVRRLAAFNGEEEAVLDWQGKRGGGERGIVEIEVQSNDQE